MKGTVVVLRRRQARLRAGFVLLLAGWGLRAFGLGGAGLWPAAGAAGGMLLSLFGVVMVWSGLEGFMSALAQGLTDLSGAGEGAVGGPSGAKGEAPAAEGSAAPPLGRAVSPGSTRRGKRGR